MENDEPQLHAVLDFLNRCGFSNAAYALRNEAVSRGFEIPDGRVAPGSGEVNTGLSFVKIAPGGGEVSTGFEITADENSMPLLLSPVRTTTVRIAPGGGEVNTGLGFSSSGDFGSVGLLPFVKIAPGGGEVSTGLASSSGDFGSTGSLPFELRNSYLLPPLKTSPGGGEVNPGLASSSSSSSGDFVSIGSSPFELRNPYGIWSPSRTGSSSARNSEFGTAREYNESILFGDSGWYGDQFAGCFNDPYLLGSNHSEVKFGMSIEAEKFLKQEGSCFTHGVKQESCVGLGSDGVYGCSIPVCDFYKGNGEEKQGGADMMENDAEMLNGCEYNGGHLKRADGLDRGTDDRVLESLSGEKLKSSMDETSNLAFTDFVPEFMQNKNLTTVHFLEKNNSEVLGNGDNYEKRLCWKTSELEANDGSECGIVDGDIKDSKSLRADGEDDDYPDDLQLFTSHEVELETFDLRIIHRKNRTGFEENKDLQIVLNSIVAGRYYLTDFLGSATFSKVVQARDLHTGTDVCLKIIKNDKDFFDQSLDEIKLLKYVNKNDPSDQCHLLRLYDYFYHKEHLFIVCELLRANLYEFQKFNQDLGGDIYFTLPRIQAIARQCLEALQLLHGLKVIHCDLKPENILIKSYSRCEIKIIDLGSSCFLTDNLRLYEQSRSYRAPEVILGMPYDEKIDIWSLGCILAELYTGEVLFLNDSLAMILARMIGILGPIDTTMLENGQEAHKYFTEDYELYLRNEETDTVEYLIPKKSSLPDSLQVNDAAFLDFLGHLLQLNPERRLTASQALRHGWLSVSYKNAPQVARSLASH